MFCVMCYMIHVLCYLLRANYLLFVILNPEHVEGKEPTFVFWMLRVKPQHDIV